MIIDSNVVFVCTMIGIVVFNILFCIHISNDEYNLENIVDQKA